MTVKTIKISDNVKSILDNSRIENNVLFLAANIDRKTYVEVDKVLKVLGGKWNRKEGGHVFSSDIKDIFNNVIENGSVVDTKKTFEIFETPEDLARKMATIVIAHNNQISSLLEPSAGSGRLINAFMNQYSHSVEITAIEIEDTNYKKLTSNIHITNVIHGDFLEFENNENNYDVILMNPPFSKNKDIKHIMHAYEMLNANGILVAISSPHHTFAEDKTSQQFREFISTLEHDNKAVVEELPEETFKSEGTSVNTMLLILKK